MYGRRKKYYHKTIVLKNVFSSGVLFLAVFVFAIGILASVLGGLSFTPSRTLVMRSFDTVFSKGDIFYQPKSLYDRMKSMIPAIQSADEMMKKYSARYGGVEKENEQVKNDEGQGVSENIKSIDMSAGGITFRNETAYTPNADAFLNQALVFTKTQGQPRVLIMHTHTSEAYSESNGARTTENAKNVVRVGEVIAERLNAKGINTIHDTTRNDYPAYNGSYNKALKNIKAQIEKNPSIEIVLDVHRDYAEQTKDGVFVQLKPVAEVEGGKVAQVMFVIGTDASGLTHPEWKHNLAFAVQVQAELNKISPKIARPINLRRERFNQHLSKGSMIIEVGTAGNTITECENAGAYIADAIAAVLNQT